MSGRRAQAAGAGALALVAVLFWALVPTWPNYDAYYHLVWGRELLAGQTPSFEAYAAPTQHPLYVLVAGLLGAVLGTDADRALVLIALLCLVALAWGTFRLGAAVFGRWPGLVGAFFVGTSFAFLLFAVRAYVDVPFLAIVVWAAALEAQRPRRGTFVMALLAIAGLLRPEAWVLAGAYWLWLYPGLDRRGRAAMLALAAAAPVLWALSDVLVTGDPLFSLHSTSDLADELNRPRGLGDVPGRFVSFIADTARPPVALLGLAGLVAGWRLLGPRRIGVPLALLGAGALTFVATGIAGLSILPRYLTIPVVAVCVFAGYALAGFTTLPPGRLRDRWRAAAVAGLALGAVFAAFNLGTIGRLRDELRFLRDSHRDLDALIHAPAFSAARACGPITYPTYRLVPDTRWILDLPRRSVSTRAVKRRPAGAEVVVLGAPKSKAVRRYGRAAGVSRHTQEPSPGFAFIGRRGIFAAYGRCPGAP